MEKQDNLNGILSSFVLFDIATSLRRMGYRIYTDEKELETFNVKMFENISPFAEFDIKTIYSVILKAILQISGKYKLSIIDLELVMKNLGLVSENNGKFMGIVVLIYNFD